MVMGIVLNREITYSIDDVAGATTSRRRVDLSQAEWFPISCDQLVRTAVSKIESVRSRLNLYIERYRVLGWRIDPRKYILYKLLLFQLRTTICSRDFRGSTPNNPF